VLISALKQEKIKASAVSISFHAVADKEYLGVMTKNFEDYKDCRTGSRFNGRRIEDFSGHNR
jgi:hypothetical protein